MSALTNLKQKLDTWFSAQSESEQRLIKLASSVFVIFMIYLVINTIQTGLSQAENKLKQQQALNVWAEQQIAIIKSSKIQSGSGSSASGSITQIINGTARKHKITIERIQPQKTDLVKVGIDEISFSSLISWLQELQTKYGITASNIDFSKAENSGMVKIRRLDLERN